MVGALSIGNSHIASGDKAPTGLDITWAGGFTAGSVPHTTAIGTTLGTVSASDPDGDGVTYAIHADPDGVFSLTGATLKLGASVSASTQHSVTIRASDGGGAYIDATFTITVT
jgi:hypothetical protein